MGWNNRLAWAGETPLNWPGLNPVAFGRFESNTGGDFPDAVTPSRVWTALSWASSSDATVAGRWGRSVGMNRSNPATEQRRMTLPNFAGLWPSTGRLLIGMWVQQSYTMAFNPLLSTRGGSSPLVYLSTRQNGSPRHQVYGAGGALVLDQYETGIAWSGSTGWLWLGQYLDIGAQTSRLISIERDTGKSWLGPARALSGAPNTASTAALDVFALQSSSYWSGGYMDEVLVAQPTAAFDLAGFVDALARGTWARGSDSANVGKLTVTDSGVTASAAATLSVGAESVSWTTAPEPSIAGSTAYRSTDGGATWLTGALPASFTGLLRWDVPLAAGDVFTGLDLWPPSPTLAAIADRSAYQRDTVTVPLTATYSGPPTWTVAASGVTASVTGSTLTIDVGWASGTIPVTVTLRDEHNRTATRSFTLSVTPQPWSAPPPPQYPRTPIVIWDEVGPSAAIIDSLSAVVTKEVNGAHTLEFAVPVQHRQAALIRNERVVELGGERYRIRRVTTDRRGRVPSLTMFCEARFYDLAYAGQLPARDFLQTPAGAAMEIAVAGTGWTIGAVTVTTRRTYSVEATNPLALLRTIQQQHGGDLLFDNVARTVSLVTQSGRDNGVAFFYGRGLSGSKRVADTSSLITRIYARNADGLTIASVNGGLPFVQDTTWTSEIREATYEFAAGASPYMMLSMAQATLAARSKPAFSYEFTVADLSHMTGQALDVFDVGDLVTVVDDELSIREAQRILAVEHDVIRPWASKITLSGKLREAGSTSAAVASGLSTGSGYTAFDLVPYNLLKNGRFDGALAHWASSGVSVVSGDGTGDYAVRFTGSGTRWVEQTVQPDNRDVYSLSFQVKSSGTGVPPLKAIATVTYEDGTSEAIPIELA